MLDKRHFYHKRFPSAVRGIYPRFWASRSARATCQPGAATGFVVKVRLKVADEEAMTALGAALGPLLRAGDCVELRGDLGVGKTTLARSIIRARAGEAIDVPSPSFSLVETYEMDTPVHHVDLYRLEGFKQATELGLEDLFDRGIVMIEWPDRAAPLLPADTLKVTISEDGGARLVVLEASTKNWQDRLTSLARGRQ
jgi:tRNA threonylcarbamoyl adenosine modification protein YjeE